MYEQKNNVHGMSSTDGGNCGPAVAILATVIKVEIPPDSTFFQLHTTT
ncbi:MAG: hypothetical protein KGH85_08565 [Thaumarchaeota archaeon]|nr:hypothetical protein [Candidatus Nitrosotalea sp.]MDE1812897.1 hypothetical protein [Nitrososphaerota archaeon]